MPRKRQHLTLSQLEQKLSQLNVARERVIAQIRAAVEHLTAGSYAPMAGLHLQTTVARKQLRRRRREISPAARAKLRASLKARWAAAKKAGKTRLG
jgi:hypothetical protein